MPALALTAEGGVLAFAEGRRLSPSDTGLIEIVMRRSDDYGQRFFPLDVVVREPAMTCGNPTPVVDTSSGVLFLPFCKNRQDGPEPLIFAGKAPRTAWITRSIDGGRTFSEPTEITSSVKRADWSWFAFGPGHGLCTASGRLVVPSVHAQVVKQDHSDPCRAHVTLSDDHGESWRPGGVIDVKTSSECELVEVGANRLYLNARIEVERAGRVSAWSADGGESFGEVTVDARLTDATCQGSLAARFADHPEAVVLVNAVGPKRERLSVWVSDDSGQNFHPIGLLESGKAAYSDLIRLPDGTFLCLYECGNKHPYERIRLAHFDLC